MLKIILHRQEKNNFQKRIISEGGKSINWAILQNMIKGILEPANENIFEEIHQSRFRNSKKYFSKMKVNYKCFQRKIKLKEFTVSHLHYKKCLFVCFKVLQAEEK